MYNLVGYVYRLFPVHSLTPTSSRALVHPGRCETCNLTDAQCPGHMGHIELPVPLFNPIILRELFQLLRTKCFTCHKFRLASRKVKLFIAKLQFIDAGLIEQAGKIDGFLGLRESGKRIFGDEDENTPDAKVEAEALIAEAARVAAAKGSVSRENTTHLHDLRRQTISQFFSKVPTRRCDNCRAHCPALRKDGATKIFRLPLSTKAQGANDAMDITQDAVLPDDAPNGENVSAGGNKPQGQGTDSNSDSESESDSDSAAMQVDQGKKGKSGKKKKKTKGKGKSKTASKVGEEEDNTGTEKISGNKAIFMPPMEVEEHMKRLWGEEKLFLDLALGSLLFGDRSRYLVRKSDPGIFFLRALPVPPSRFRPPSMVGDQLFEHSQNVQLGKLLTSSALLMGLTRNTDGTQQANPDFHMAKALNIMLTMQEAVNVLFDSTKGSNAAAAAGPQGIRQELEKKEGLFRKNMMGKRVNFACRSVLSPDPYLDVQEIGIPHYFAKNLTYVQPVFTWNVEEMRQAVINGPEVHPGANYVEDEFGHKIDLKFRSKEQREALAKRLLTSDSITGDLSADGAAAGAGAAAAAAAAGAGGAGGIGNPVATSSRGPKKKVWRHLRTGDVVLVNRQPTLHKPSIMAHHARVLSHEKTLRMHYANCNTYNADFDGDEINVHFLQSELARSEGYHIANTDNQYLVPTSGKPLRGLIQDHVIAGTRLTKKDSFLNRGDFVSLTFAACRALSVEPRRVKIPVPAILKPIPLWTGKQVISTVLQYLAGDRAPLNLDSKDKIPATAWAPFTEEGMVIVRDNELLTGVLEKSQYGASSYGLVHAVYELYGARDAGLLLTNLGRLFTHYLQMYGFTVGMDDLLLKDSAEKVRTRLLKKANKVGVSVAAQYTKAKDPKTVDERALSQALGYALFDEGDLGMLDSKMKSALNPITSEILGTCLKGDGQYKGFPENNMNLMTTSGAKGSQVNTSQISCLLGQQELEGKRVPLMVSGKTLPSFDAYDPNARAGGFVMDRFLTGIRPQEYFFHCMAGREGLVDTAVKTSRSGYLQRCLIKHLEGLKVEYDLTVRDRDGSIVQFAYGEDGLDPTRTAFLKKFGFLAHNYQALMERYDPNAAVGSMEVKKAGKYLHKQSKERRKSGKLMAVDSGAAAPVELKYDDPVASVYQPDRHLGSAGENYLKDLSAYLKDNPDALLADGTKNDSLTVPASARELTPDKFEVLMWLKYAFSLMEPGEPVGVLAGQSVGEPSTQMTLNTFHFAGVGGANVTLGIPRLREILMTASKNISTPTMTLPVLPKVERDVTSNLAQTLSRVYLSEVLSQVVVTESAQPPDAGLGWTRFYDIELKMDNFEQAAKHYYIDFDLVSRCLEIQFLPLLLRAFKKELKAGGTGDKIIGTAVADNHMTEADAAAMEEGSGKRRKEKGDALDDDDKQARARINADLDKDDNDAAAAAATSYDTRTGERGAMETDGGDDDGGTESLLKHKERLLERHPMLSDYCFDSPSKCRVTLKVPANSKKLLVVDLVESATRAALVRATRGLKKTFVTEPKPDTLAITTEGVNFNAAWRFPDYIDLNNLMSNDIHAILTTYGVEAARTAITKEVSSVFGVYGISVDPRHLSLIADYMTFEGGYKPFNRMGIESNTSPFLKMTFETTMHFLTDAALSGAADDLSSPAAQIVMGQVAEVGTKAFDVRQPVVSPSS
eukprot:TRINITY_DN690_c0_g1_i4.p1 TRINITY_DN690_c0_g1~~TRINITY_DN690_c0_g1_i4.p1  ORF type:complete len:1694 (+),score=564.87 TRINITY_DN690_c0_g1_i4:426-5507(+)